MTNRVRSLTCVRSGALLGDIEHCPREVQADDLRSSARTGERQRQIARARANVQHHARLCRQGLLNGPPPPAVVHPEADQEIEQVVARRDRVKHRPHPGGLTLRHGVSREC